MEVNIMNSLDIEMEKLITRINDQEGTIKAYRKLTESLKLTIKELRNDARSNRKVSGGD